MLRLFLLALLVLLPAMLDACCMPEKFFAIRTNAKTGLRSSYVVDFETQRVAITPNNQPDYPVQYIINDFNTGTSYTQYKSGECRKGKVLKYFLYARCQPPAAKLRYADFLGKKTLKTKTYEYKYGKTKVQMTVTNDGNCYPLMRRQDPDDKDAETKAITFSNVKELSNTDQYLKRDLSNCF